MAVEPCSRSLRREKDREREKRSLERKMSKKKVPRNIPSPRTRASRGSLARKGDENRASETVSAHTTCLFITRGELPEHVETHNDEIKSRARGCAEKTLTRHCGRYTTERSTRFLFLILLLLPEQMTIVCRDEASVI